MADAGMTTPVIVPEKGGLPRGLPSTRASSRTTGRFGRMSRHLPVYQHQVKTLVELGDSMIQELENGRLDEPLGTADPDENTAKLDGELRLPAGYTYFGQFVHHHLTFDPFSSLPRP